MQITEVSSDEVLAVLAHPPASVGVTGQIYERSSGVHVSDIIRDIENTVTKPGKRPRISDLLPEERKRMGGYVSMGWAWEDMIRDAMMRTVYGGQDRYIRLGEIERDEIYASPDCFDMEDGCVEEFKATWRSMRRDLATDFWSWMVQTKAYCHMTETNWVRFRVFWVCGDYRASGPTMKTYQIRYETLELERNWAMLTTHRDKMGQEAGR